MSTRIGTFGAEQLYLSRLGAIQSKMQDEQSQVTTGLKSTTYSGIASQADSALNLGNENTVAQQYISDNTIANTKLDAMSTSLSSIRTTITNLINQLNQYSEGDTSDPTQIQTLQNAAMNSMADLQSYLGVNIDGQYLFSGGRVATSPVNLPASTLAQFQALYNGSTTLFPTTRAGDLADINLTSTQTGAVTFDPTNGLIIPANADAYSSVPSSSYVQVAGTTGNNGSFTVTGHAATSSAGTMLSEAGSIGSGATITYDGGTKTATNAQTGNLAFSFNSAGQMVVTPANVDALQGLAAIGTTFTINGSDSSVSDLTAANASSVALTGTNVYTYPAGSTSPTGVTIAGGDQLTITDNASNSVYTYKASAVTSTDPLTSIQSASPAAPITVGDTLTFQVGAGTVASFPVTANSTVADLTSFIRQQDPDASVSFTNGQLSVTNGNTAPNTYTLGGSLVAKLGLGTSVAPSATMTGTTNSLGDLVNWVNNTTGGAMTASVDAQGHVTLKNTSASSDFISVGGSLDGLLGFNSSSVVAGGASITSSQLYLHANAQTLTSLQNGSGSPLVASGDTLTFGSPATATLKVGATTTLTDLTQWIQSQDSKASVSFSGGQLSITNGSGTDYTFGGTLVTSDHLVPATVTAGSSASGTAVPVVPGTYDGAYQVVAYNSDGSVVLANDTTPGTAETPDATAVTLGSGTPPGTAFSTGLTSGDASFTISGDTVTMTLPSATNSLTPTFAVGKPITISGTADHNGTYTVSAVTANTVSFQVNPDALRVSQLVQQTGRTDETMTFTTTAANTTTGSATNTVPGTVVNGKATVDSSVFGGLNFTPSGTGGEKISSNIPNALVDSFGAAYPPAGTVITLKSTSGVNDGSYTVVSNDGTNMVVKGNTLTAESGSTTASMTASSWYQGDTQQTQQAVATNRQVDIGIFASDPAFEKAIRAMGVLCEGVTGTAGGLENHPERVAAAQYLLNQALQSTSGGTPPYGTEETSSVTQLSENVGYTQSVIATANTNHTAYMGFVDTQIGSIESADQTVAITTLLADSNALQASYQALARVSQLSLLNYLPAA